ncbi:hypothetical protein PVAP13_4NG330133 [Panicum virgatum]|uniref:Uncharacterized protein n=1 Tax=Panicum virgatum TaxID=38727 RepID=A0A8T0TEB9_PANVG|nr:hypothetical protein PVAP13_4NG330133 [Panicum virgatum]
MPASPSPASKYGRERENGRISGTRREWWSVAELAEAEAECAAAVAERSCAMGTDRQADRDRPTYTSREQAHGHGHGCLSQQCKSFRRSSMGIGRSKFSAPVSCVSRPAVQVHCRRMLHSFFSSTPFCLLTSRHYRFVIN